MYRASPRSTPLLGAAVHAEDKKDLVRVVADEPFSGEKCLEIGDSSELKAAYNPHITFSPGHKSGTSRVGFALRMQKNAEAHIEWRDNAQPYKVGPGLRVKDGKLTFKDKPPLDFPTDQWVQFDISARVGEQAGGSWDLSVTLPSGRKREWKNLKPGHADWRTFEWLGFCNLGRDSEAASFFLDDLKIACEP